MLDCNHTTKLISRSREEKISLTEWAGVRFHLIWCAACRNFSRQIEILRNALRGMVVRTENDDSVRLTDEARERITKKLHES